MPVQWRIDRKSWRYSPKMGVNQRIFERLYSHGLDMSLQCN
jgi:hypothetical protein